MAERLILTIPAVPAIDVDYRLVSLAFDWGEETLAIRLLGAGGQRVGHQYTGATAVSLMRALNKADFSAVSLQRRVLQRLVADGIVNGAIAGAPE